MDNKKSLVVLIFTLLLYTTVSYIWEFSGTSNISDLSNQSLINSFCAANGPDYEKSGTSYYLDTFKNSGSCNGIYPNIQCDQTWFEWQGGSPNQVYCFGNNTGHFYQRSFINYKNKFK